MSGWSVEVKDDEVILTLYAEREEDTHDACHVRCEQSVRMPLKRSDPFAARLITAMEKLDVTFELEVAKELNRQRGAKGHSAIAIGLQAPPNTSVQ